MRGAALVMLALGGLGAVGGCARLLGFDDFVAGVSDAAPPSEVGPGGDGEPADARWHVSPAGDDANDGTRERPVRSVSKAVSLAAASDAATPASERLRIAVCVGDYVERTLEISGRIDVRGNYDCTTWLRLRPDASVRGPSIASASRVRQAEVDAKVAEFFVRSRGGAAAPLLDGLAFSATRAGTVIAAADATALLHLTVDNSTDVSGPGVTGSAGIVVASGAGFRVEHCRVTVTQALNEASAANGVGIAAVGGTGAMRRNVVSVAKVVGSCAGITAADLDLEIAENDIRLEQCITKAEGKTIGIASASATARTFRNDVGFLFPGSVAGVASGAFVVGLSATGGASGHVESDGDRVVAPTQPHPTYGAATGATFLGVFDDGALTKLVNASMWIDGTDIVFNSSSGVFLSKPSTAYLAHNTFYLSALKSQSDRALNGIAFIDSVLDAGPSSAVTLESNLVVTDDARLALLRTSCTAPGVARAAHNRHGGFVSPTRCDGGEDLAVFFGGADASDNVALDCPDGGCAGLFLSGVGHEQQLRLHPEAGCAPALGVPFSGAVPVDGTGGSRREAGTAVGAFERICD